MPQQFLGVFNPGHARGSGCSSVAQIMEFEVNNFGFYQRFLPRFFPATSCEGSALSGQSAPLVGEHTIDVQQAWLVGNQIAQAVCHWNCVVLSALHVSKHDDSALQIDISPLQFDGAASSTAADQAELDQIAKISWEVLEQTCLFGNRQFAHPAFWFFQNVCIPVDISDGHFQIALGVIEHTAQQLDFAVDGGIGNRCTALRNVAGQGGIFDF